MTTYSASYDPLDNKLRLRASARLDSELYARVRAAGFIWAPKQDLFVAPKWTPEREDLLLELCEEIEDEDTSLVDRAEERAERFETYSDKREADAHAAKAHVESITSGIPLGQPILVGHHSERRARKDAEKIENGMRKAVKMWETSKYWERRAAGAIRAAKYKELPTVRARRIKTIEAELRKAERSGAAAAKEIALWTKEGLTRARALAIANYGRGADVWSDLDADRITPEQARDKCLPNLERSVEHARRWGVHLNMRLIYERCMLEEAGYVEPAKVKSLKETLPLLNYRQDVIDYPNEYHRGETVSLHQVAMTKAEYAKVYKDYKGTRIVDRSHKVRIAMNVGGTRGLSAVFLTDSKVHKKSEIPAPIEPALPAPRMPRPAYVPPARTEFDDIKDSLKAGVQVVSAPQLFPTPPDIAARMVELADIKPGHVVVEPSAGTGRLLLALDDGPGLANVTAHAVEINSSLVRSLRDGFQEVTVHEGDFLAFEYSRRAFADRVVMNPPFASGADIEHIQRAISILKPGGLVVAICANGPRQQAKLKPLATTWEELPEGSFAPATNVRTVLATFAAPVAA